ncbi:hypothetical protein [Palleronia sp. LCG004]|uniref:hypothetical protein n=1 Tax=Palleronia sp. LCG004 TaxID=3079304 RepID=UPI0029437F97|nr:hypothetical protein [Palleronia sp. LCG004]WOI54944.1 hypothetical protein RVY76_07655 [Palleronia sp. LCG004]
MSRLYLVAAGAVGVLLMIGAIYWAGRDDAFDAAHRRALEADRDTSRRIDDADIGSGQPVGDREWLRDRGER